MRCANCNKELTDITKYCSECLDYLFNTGKLEYADVWKYKISGGGCIGCRYFLEDGDKCESCVRIHVQTIPLEDHYEKEMG